MKRILISTVACAGLIASSLVGGLSSSAGAADLPYKVTTLHFKVVVGAEKKTCDVVGDLYVPNDASETNRMPAILTTNGFGGSKNDQAGLGKYGASNGYVVLSYSGLGFGGSGCQITLDDPDYDGQAASQLVSYLGGAPGIAYLDSAHTQAAPVMNDVIHDATDHNGVAQQYDPRVGMIGGSYGGEIQFAVAGDDPRMDTIIPMITWNDLSYSLAPNNANQVGDTLASAKPGNAKLVWALGFSALGIVDGLQNAQADPTRMIPCPNFATWVCPGLLNAGVTGTLDPATQANLKHASVQSYMSKIKIPVLLAQGEFDTLFNLNEAAATYKALQAQGTPVSMIWHSWGHSSSAPQPGEFNSGNPDPANQYETGRVFDWFAHYLKGQDVSTGPGFAYFQDWVPYTGNAAPAFGTANEYGDFPNERYYLGSSALTTEAASGTGSQQFFTAPGGLPTSINPIDVVGSMLPLPETDLPNTFATWTSPALTQNLDVVGSPVLNLKVDAPLSAALGAAGQPVTDLALFIRIQDVAPNGTATDIRQLTAPIRVNPSNAFTVRLPAIVHQFATGHKIKLIVAGGSINYRGGLIPNMVTIAGGSTQTLDLPTPQLPVTPPVTPPAGPNAPSAPMNVTAVPSGSSATISWSTPNSDGGSAITGYTVTCAKGNNKFETKTTTATSATFTGFLNGAHQCAVSATNAAGTSGVATSNVFTIAVPPTTPSTIYIKVSRTAKGRTVHLWWSASNGNGSKITYVITSPHHKTVRVTGKSVWLYGLPKGRSAFVVKATSGAGTSRGATAVAIFKS